MMEPSVIIALLAAVLAPLGGVVTAAILDRRSKKISKDTTMVAAKEAATHEFEAITAGYTDYTTKLEARAAKTDALEKRMEEMEKTLSVVLEYVEALEHKIPVKDRPPRPDLQFRR